jgi:long-chain acyl-CoA synthetase
MNARVLVSQPAAGAPAVWADVPLPDLRLEAHFGDRLLSCFSERASNLHALFEHTVDRHGDRLAMVWGDQRWTWQAVADQSARVATGLKKAGLAAGDRVILYQTNHPSFVLAMLALQRLGALAVAVGPREQKAGLAWIMQHSGARGVVCDVDLLDRLPSATDVPELQWAAWVDLSLPMGEGYTAHPAAAAASTQRPCIGFDQWLRESPCTEVQPVQEEDTAFILYTSGTTGRPKGAMLTHFNVVHSVQHFVSCMDLSERDRSMLAVPVTHVTGLIANLMTVVGTGAALLILPSFTAQGFLQLAAREGMTHTLMVPAMYKLLLLEPTFASFDLSAWRIGGFGGAPMPPSTIEEMAQQLPGLHLLNAYGATETTSPTTLMPMGQTRAHADTVGAPLPSAAVAIMDDEGRQLPAGEVGEIWISGPMVVKGYWNDPAATAREFTAGWWHSGDLGSVDAEGYVRVLDRKKDMINRGGYKVFSTEVESTLLRIPGVVEAAVVGVPCPVLGERVHAFVHTLREDLSTAEMKAFCLELLADYKVPESLVVSPVPLPRNPNGKLLKRELRQRLS